MSTDSWKQIYNKAYQVQKGERIRSDAIAKCEALDGKLFEPKTATENVNVLELLTIAGIQKIVWNYAPPRDSNDFFIIC